MVSSAACAGTPTLSTPTHTAITSTGATLGATITGNGGSAITVRGTCWGPLNNPVTNCVAEGGTAVSEFSHARVGLTCNTTYYYRGYATNVAGNTGYSVSDSFTTSACPAGITFNRPANCVIPLLASKCQLKPTSLTGALPPEWYGLFNETTMIGTPNIYTNPAWTYNPSNAVGVGKAIELVRGNNVLQLWRTTGSVYQDKVNSTVIVNAECDIANGHSWSATNLRCENAAGFSCINPIANATLYDAEESTGLMANTDWVISASDTGPKCQAYCNAGYVDVGGVCQPRNLTSDLDPLTLASGALTQGTNVTFNGRVRNTGNISISTAFSDNFTYCWGAGCNSFAGNVISVHLKSAPFAPSATQNDVSASFTLANADILRVQHCIDSGIAITESNETVADNCTVTDFNVVAAGGITLNTPADCKIPLLASKCLLKPTSLTGAVAPEWYGLQNVTTGVPSINLYTDPTWTYDPAGGAGTAIELVRGNNVLQLWRTTGSVMQNIVNAPVNVSAECDIASGHGWSIANSRCEAGGALPTPTGFKELPVACGGNIELSWDHPVAGVDSYIISVDSIGPVNIGNVGSVSYIFAPGSSHDFSLVAHNNTTGNSAPKVLNGVVASPACPVAEDGQCGPAARVYGFNESGYVGNYCSVGTEINLTPFPVRGDTGTWICEGSLGGDDTPCSAPRDNAPSPVLNVARCDIEDEFSYCISNNVVWDLQAGSALYLVTNTDNGESVPTPTASTSANITNNSASRRIQLDFGDNFIEGTADGVVLASVLLRDIKCKVGSFWHTGLNVCKKKPDLTITTPANDNTWIRSGASQNISYRVIASYPVRCSYTPATGGILSSTSKDFANPVGPAGGVDTFTVGPLKSAQKVSITCQANPPIADSIVSKEVRVNVIPDIEER